MTKRSFIRFLFTFICVFALACVLMPGPAKADFVTYITRSWNGSAVNSTEATRNDVIPFPESQEIAPGWYYVNRNITINGRVSLQGDTQIILGDGYKLDVKGLYIPGDCTLTIYAQSNGKNAGKLYSHPSGGAAIGGYSGHDNGSIVIHGGTVQAIGASHCAGIGTNDGKTGGSIAIYGGTITAKGGEDGAAIGGGRYCDGGKITIYGGNITANGPTDSDTWEDVAGIGGGYKGAGGTINIYGGTITTYSRDGAGIGGGDDGAGGTITIHGGTITSTKVNQGQGARIGGGCDGKPGTIVINGGKITANGGSGAGIGGGKGNKSGGSVTINGGDITTTGSYGIGKGEDGSAVTVTLDYTDVTKDTLSITASSFKGSVTVKRPFVNGNSVFYPGTITQGAVQNGYLANSALTAWDELPTTWSMMQHAMNQVVSAGRTIRLGADLTAGPGEITLKVNTGYNFTIDLNGHTINRNLVAEANDASVIFVAEGGTLTITDSAGGGVITGGFATDGGGIYNKGTLTIRGGTIRNNTATNSGGGIHNLGTLTIAGGTICENKAMQAGGGINNSGTVTLTGGEIRGNAGNANGGGVYNTGTMTMTGGSITNNGAGLYHGGGIFNSGTLNLRGGIISKNSAAGRLGGQGGGVLNNGTLKIAGAPVVRDNTALTGDDIFLRTGHPTMTVTGALTEGAGLSVYAERGTGAVTSGYSTYNSAAPDSFFSVTGAHCLIELENGEAVFNRYYEVSVINLDATADKDLAQEGETVTVTLNTLPEEGTSVHYRYYDGEFKTETAAPGADNTFTITMPASSVTVYREMTWADLTRIIDDTCARYGSVTIKLPNNITAAEGDAALHITNFSAVTLDLNGCRLDRGLAGKEESDSAFRIDMYGRLNIMDTCPETPGGITGANGAPAVLVGTGYLTLDGGNIYNNTTTAGAAVYVNNGGSFTMNGGTISGNHAEVGAGVYVNEKGSFTMNGGAIIANEAQMGAGVLSFGTFTLKNGEISANRATGMIDNNTPYAGGGAAILQGEFNMQGGEIRDNSGTGYGGGLLLGEGTSRISGGTICYNTSTMHGSGVCNLVNAMTMTGGSIIGNTVTAPSSATATYGAGVVIMSEASLTVSGTPTIQGNAYNKDGYYSLQCDVLLSPGNVIQMNGPLTDSTRLYVWPGVPGKTVTRGLKAYGGTDPLNIIRLNASQQQQESEHPFHIMLDADGEAVLGWKWKVLYQDEHSGQESEQPVVMGMEAYELLPNMFGALNGEYFYGWEIDGEQYVPGNRIAIPEVPTAQMETDFIRIQAVWGGEFYTVSFDKGAEDAGGRMPEIRTAQDEPYTLPECDFIAPEHKVFNGWLVGDAAEPQAAGTEVTLNGDTLLTAAWRWETIGVSFDPNGGTGSMDGTELDYGEEYVLPACGFTAPDGLYFGGWLINGDPAVLYPGEIITVTGETIARPRWNGLWGHLQVQLRTMEGSSLTLTLPADATAESGDTALLIPEGKAVVLDLNGHTLNRGNPDSIDCVIHDLGTLTIRDSSEGKTGVITGGTDGGVVVGLYEVDGEDYLHSIVKSGSLILASGTISGNSRNSARGGGVAVVQGSFTMTGGEISGNSARQGGGVHIDTQNGYQTSRFTMSGGRIRNNTANYRWGAEGGGLKGEDAEIILSGGEISGNTVIGDNGRGGGVAIEQSTLTLSGCRITGNSAGQNGGGISAEGRYYEGVLDEPSTVVMTGGEISGNSAVHCGGGIYAESNVSVTVSGGRITGNTSDTRLCGGGILQGVETRIILSGSPVITGNTAGGETDNINLAYEAISISGDLSEDALVGVTIDPEESTLPEENGGVAITSGLSGRGSAANFTSDSSSQAIGMDADGEAILGAVTAVSFDPGDENAEGEMEGFTTAAGSTYILPECGYTLEGNNFQAWLVTVGDAEPVTRLPDEAVTITADTTVRAVWGNIVATPEFDPAGGQYNAAQEVAITSGTEGAAIHYTTDGTDPTADSTLYTDPVPVAVTATVKAIAVREGMIDSPVAESVYTILHRVSVTAGEGMTKTDNSGDAEQEGVSGEMTAVVYTAGEGYYFPADYGTEPVNGVSVTRDSYTQITVSGAPTSEVVVKLADAAAKTIPDAPDGLAATDCTGADNNDGTLTGTTAEMEYRKSGDEAWTDVSGETVTGLTPGTYEIRVKATDTSLASESVVLTVAAFKSKTATPVFSPEAGEFEGSVEVAISCETNGATIYYTTNGDVPTAESSVYSTPVTLAGTATIKAFAAKEGMTDSDAAEAAYTITYGVAITEGVGMTKTEDSGDAAQAGLTGPMEPVVYIADDGYYFPADYSVESVNGVSTERNSFTQITVSGTPSANAEILLPDTTAKGKPDIPAGVTAADCTTNENNDGIITGVTAEMEYRKSDAEAWNDGTGNDITGLMPGTYYVRVKATDTTLPSDELELAVLAYTMEGQVTAPVFSPAAGTYAEAQEVTISCETEDATIYYTTDGTVPTTESTKYTAPVSIAVSTVLKAIAVREDMTDSPVAEAEYTITYKVEVFAGEGMTRVADSGEDEQAGISGRMEDVVYTADDGYYFPADYTVEPVNGITARRDSLTQITVSGTPAADTVITLPDAAGRPAAPTEPTATGCTNFDNNDGTLTGITVDMEYQIVGAEAWIKGTGETITGLEPGAYLIRYKATDEAIASEALILAIAAYIAPDEIALPVFEPEDGNSFGTLEISITCATEGAVIRYTTDGTEPDADSPAYTGPIMLGTGDWTIRAVAMADGAPDSEIATAVYHIGYIPCGGEIRVRKALSGRDWTEKDAFEFTVEKSGDAPVTEKGTVLVTGESENHTESFGNVTFTRPGTYSWTITETHQGETIRGVRYAEEGQTVTITVKDDGTGKLIADQGVELTQTVTFTNTFEPEPFGDATFILPSGVKTIEASAFEGDTLISVVDAGNCENIGAYAFSGCTGLTKIRLPINCTIGEHAFDGCTALYAIYGPAGGSTQDWAEDHDILFIGE